MDKCKRGYWLDKSLFLIHHIDGRVKVRRFPGEQLLTSFTEDHKQVSSGRIIVGNKIIEINCVKMRNAVYILHQKMLI